MDDSIITQATLLAQSLPGGDRHVVRALVEFTQAIRADLVECKRRNLEIIREHDGLRRSEREWRRKQVAAEADAEFQRLNAKDWRDRLLAANHSMAKQDLRIEKLERAIKSMAGPAGDAIRKVTGLEDTP